MACPVDDVYIEQLQSFIEMCNKQPSIIHHPKLYFFKSFIQKLGGKIPSDVSSEREDSSSTFDNPPEDPESEESDVELDMTGVIDPDSEGSQPMGDYDLQPTEEQMEQSQEKRSQAVSAFVEKDYDKAIKLYTDAISLNPQNSLLYAKRGQIYLLMKKPNACIRDCNRAMELNPDSAAAHKFRGRAHQLLGKFEEAANDLRKACKFDYDEQADEWLKEVTPNSTENITKPQKRGEWSEEDLKIAVSAIKSKEMTVLGASKAFKIPKSTLFRYLKNNRSEKLKNGRRFTLDDKQNSGLVDHIKQLAAIGYTITPKVLRRSVYNFCEANKIKHRFSKKNQMGGKNWVRAFKNLNPSISIEKKTIVSSTSSSKNEQVDQRSVLKT